MALTSDGQVITLPSVEAENINDFTVVTHVKLSSGSEIELISGVVTLRHPDVVLRCDSCHL